MESSDYEVFATSCVEELKLLQEAFLNGYDVNGYANWFYNESTGLLTFSTGDEQINFKYFSVGSFSPVTGTWKWSWDNATTQDAVKQEVDMVRQYGEEHLFPKLTLGYFAADEYEAWEFVAIAAKLAGGIGVYRPVSDQQLQLFLVVTSFVDEAGAKRIKDRYIECEYHEWRRLAFVCQHLNHTTPVGFEEAFDTVENMELGEDDDLQAWCNACEGVRVAAGEWNDDAQKFAAIKLVCEKCYFEMKELNLGCR